MYSLIETAELNGFDPQLYLTDIIVRIADHPARQITELIAMALARAWLHVGRNTHSAVSR